MKFKEWYLIENVLPVDISFIDELKSVKNKVIDKNLGTIEVLNIFNNKLGRFGIKFEQSGYGTSDNSNYAKFYIRNASTYNSGLIEISVEDEFWEVFKNEDNWEEFIKALKNIVSHEMVHRNQIQKVENKNKKNTQNILDKLVDKGGSNISDSKEIQEYLSKKWESMAFAKEAVEEFRSIGYSDSNILNRIKHPFNREIYPDSAESHIFYRYSEYFDTNDKPFKDFLKYMILYLNDNKKNIEKLNWIEKLSDNELKNYEKEHPNLIPKTKILIRKELIIRKQKES